MVKQNFHTDSNVFIAKQKTFEGGIGPLGPPKSAPETIRPPASGIQYAIGTPLSWAYIDPATWVPRRKWLNDS